MVIDLTTLMFKLQFVGNEKDYNIKLLRKMY